MALLSVIHWICHVPAAHNPSKSRIAADIRYLITEHSITVYLTTHNSVWVGSHLIRRCLVRHASDRCPIQGDERIKLSVRPESDTHFWLRPSNACYRWPIDLASRLGHDPTGGVRIWQLRSVLSVHKSSENPVLPGQKSKFIHKSASHIEQKIFTALGKAVKCKIISTDNICRLSYW